jgi:CheY-like chemotaxis protein
VLDALTGYGRAPDRKRALEAGFDEHLVKPVELDPLLTTLNRLLADAAAVAD